MNPKARIALGLLAAGCHTPLSSSGGDDRGEVESCRLDADVEALIQQNAVGLMEDAAFVGQATDSDALEFLYAASLYDQVASAGWVFFVGCADAPSGFEPTCAAHDGAEGYWSCVRPVCEGEDTLRIEAWFAPYGSVDPAAAGTFSIAAPEGTLWFPELPLHTWTMAVEAGYTAVSADHRVEASYVAADGRVTDVSYAARGEVAHGEAHPVFELQITYPALEEAHEWVMDLSFDEAGLDGQLLRDGRRVAAVEDRTPEGSHHLELGITWEGCPQETRPPREFEPLDCDPNARSACPPAML